MPILACRTCGRVIYPTAALDTRFAEERRCPRCGAGLAYERRTANRRQLDRRNGPTGEPAAPDGVERRAVERRANRRRRDDANASPFAGA